MRWRHFTTTTTTTTSSRIHFGFAFMCPFANPKEVEKPKALICTESKTLKDSHLCPEIKATAKMLKNRQRAGDIQNNHFQRAPSPSLVTIWRSFAIFAKPFASSSPTRAFLDISQDSDRIGKMTSSCKWPVKWYSYLNQKNQNKQND